MLPVICVLGSWSSGTTAVTGYLARIGAYSCPPHFLTNDPRTPDSHESAALRAQCLAMVDERTLNKVGDSRRFADWLCNWLEAQSQAALAAGRAHIVLKHPLLAFLAGEIAHVCAPQWVTVTRPLNAIEATRLRRQWPAVHGEKGARVVYSAAYSTLVDLDQSYLTVAFADFLTNQSTRSWLVDSLGLQPSEAQRSDAESWLR